VAVGIIVGMKKEIFWEGFFSSKESFLAIPP